MLQIRIEAPAYPFEI